VLDQGADRRRGIAPLHELARHILEQARRGQNLNISITLLLSPFFARKQRQQPHGRWQTASAPGSSDLTDLISGHAEASFAGSGVKRRDLMSRSLKPSSTSFAASGLILAAALLTSVGAQIQDRQETGNLEFLLEPEAVEHGMPQAFNFVLVNKTNHDVSVPLPTVDCQDSFDGTVWLRVDFTPLEPGPPGEGRGCVLDNFSPPTVIMDRIQAWRVLHSGDTLKLTADHTRLFYDDQQPGRYEFWATYTPPLITPRDQRLLQESGKDFPHARLRTRHVIFVKEQ
jgi:hypothetical protein